MADQDRAVFVTELKAEGVAETRTQAETVAKLRGELDKQKTSLQGMNQAYRNLKTAGLQTSKMGLDLKNRIVEQKKAIGQNQMALLQMKGGLGGVSDALRKQGAAAHGAASGLQALSAGASIAGGPVASLALKSEALLGKLGKGGLIGICIAAVAALALIDYALIKTAYNLTKMAASSADSYRSERLSIEGMTKVWRGFFGFMQRAPGNAAQMQASIDDVSSRVPIMRDRVVALNAELYKYGLRGNSLKQALEAVALGESAAGDEGRQMGINMVAGAAMFGRSVSGAAAIMKARFGPIVERQMLALPIQIAKAKTGFQQLFTGIKIEPLLRGLHNILGLFNQGTETSKAWRAIFETLFNPLFAGAEKGSFTVKRFLQGVTIMALEAAIKFKQLQGSLSLKKLGLGDSSNLLENVISGFAGLATGVLRAAQASLLLATALKRVIDAQILLIQLGPVGGIIAGIRKAQGTSFTDQFKGIADRAKSLFGGDMATAGVSMIQGMIDGIEQSKPALIEAARKAQKEVNAAVKSEQQIHSPSRKWQGFGLQMGAGQARGIRLGIAPVVAATREMQRATFADRPEPRYATPQPMIARGSTSPRPTIGELHLHVDGSKNTVTLPISQIKDVLSRLLEGVAIQQGAL